MQKAAKLVLIAALNAFSWKQWARLHWNENPGVYANTSTPSNLQGRVPDALATWMWSGAGHYPYYAGTTGRDCGDGDSWFSDDDDGYNVVDYSTTCNGGHGGLGCDAGTLATTIPIDVYNTDQTRLAEQDIVMCSNRSWADNHFFESGKYNYLGVLSHEMGHFMGLDHSSENGSEPNSLLRNATMYYSASTATSVYQRSLNKDDITGIRSIYGTPFYWGLGDAAGNSVSLSNPGGAGVSMYINPNARGSTWGNPVFAVNANLGGWIDSDSRIQWEENDKDHAIILSLLMYGVDGTPRWLHYSRNASNWWGQYYNGGRFVPMSSYPSSYNNWVSIQMNVWSDYRNAFGVDPFMCTAMRVYHWVYLGWSGDHGGSIRNIMLRGAE